MNRVLTLPALCRVWALSLSCGRKEADPFAGRLVDLSHAYDEQTVFWPTAEGFKLEKVADGVTPGGYYYAANNFSMAEHGGTHLDAPVHFAEGRNTADRVPLEQLMGAGVLLDVSEKCARDVPAFENLANLERLPARGFHVVALPMKIRGGSGGPLRAVAIVKPQ